MPWFFDKHFRPFSKQFFPFGADENRLSALPVETPCSQQQLLSGLVVFLEKVQVGRLSRGSIRWAYWGWRKATTISRKWWCSFPLSNLGDNKELSSWACCLTQKWGGSRQTPAVKGTVFSGQSTTCLPCIVASCLSLVSSPASSPFLLPC